MSQQQLLFEEVRRLCEELERPICSRDLQQAFRLEPERRPLLLQCTGQQLFKSCRYVGKRLFLIGVHQYYGYYAPDNDPRWHTAFQQIVLETQLKSVVKQRRFEWAHYLLSTDEEALARHCLAGLRQEVSAWLAQWQGSDFAIADRLGNSLVELEVLGLPESISTPRLPSLLSRQRAVILLKQEHGLRVDPDRVGHLGLNRHLAWFSRALSPLALKPSSRQLFLTEQLRHYVAWHWPLPEEDAFKARALTHCLRFGRPDC